ncbi:glycoside hydrolase family 1 protein [Glaciibacter sp. 2TAF33]|uniref:glycoside hydrolase family 1 protein n=1 Tax=Glaciibacter sp. 2TAF33 TaxID=3233015 RepID=UPI003F9201E5
MASRAWQHRTNELGDLIPSGFQVGVATAAFQIEGAAREGGRGESVWDAFSAQRGRILDGSNASVSTNHFHRYAEDVTLMRELGVDAYRFSFAWPRLQPDGRGALNRNGIAFYDRLLDRLLDAGISPMATLFHWDTPLALRGGWLNRDTALRFGDYAHEVGAVFGDRIDAWVTINEPATVMLNGYALGVHAPGDTLLFDALPTAHHQLLGHGLAVQGLRAADVRGRVGIANVHSPVEPAGDREEDRVFAELFDVLHNRIFADPVLLGRYPELPEFAKELRPLAEVDPDDLSTIHQPLDFYGLGYYMPSRVAAGSGGTAGPDGGTPVLARLPFHLEPFREFPRTGFGWPIAPEYLAVSLQELRDRYGKALPPVYITEGGASFPDTAPGTGTGTGAVAGKRGDHPQRGERTEVSDVDRVDYLAEHVTAALASVSPGGSAEGVDLRGYFVWSLLDNFEWAAGYTQRFGLVRVDFTDQARTPKLSYRWLQKVLAARS